MSILTEIWGLSLNQTILLVVAILIALDFFIPSDIPTHIAYILLCALVGINLEVHLLVKVLCALLTWFALVFFHYIFWRETLQKLANKIIAPDRIQTGANGVVGIQGTIRVIDGHTMVSVKGDLWPCQSSDTLDDGSPVIIISQKDGELEVTKQIKK